MSKQSAINQIHAFKQTDFHSEGHQFLKKIVCQEIDIIVFHACKNKDILIEFWFISKK